MEAQWACGLACLDQVDRWLLLSGVPNLVFVGLFCGVIWFHWRRLLPSPVWEPSHWHPELSGEVSRELFTRRTLV